MASHSSSSRTLIHQPGHNCPPRHQGSFPPSNCLRHHVLMSAISAFQCPPPTGHLISWVGYKMRELILPSHGPFFYVCISACPVQRLAESVGSCPESTPALAANCCFAHAGVHSSPGQQLQGRAGGIPQLPKSEVTLFREHLWRWEHSLMKSPLSSSLGLPH